MPLLSRNEAEGLLTRLVEIPSFSGDELNASTYLADAMRAIGFERCEVDGAGNAVGEIGPIDAKKTVILLGHCRLGRWRSGIGGLDLAASR